MAALALGPKSVGERTADVLECGHATVPAGVWFEGQMILPSRPAAVKKHRQHHVWQHYLKAWATKGELHCLMDRRIFTTGTSAVAVERDFYKLAKLTDADVALIRFLMINLEGLHPRTCKLHQDLLNVITVPTRFEGIAADVDDLIATFRANAFEDYHACIEASFLPLLNRALAKDIGFYSDAQSCIILFHFLASQHMRTKGVKARTVETLSRNNSLDASRIWDILGLMSAANIGMTVYLERDRRRLLLLENLTDTSFITGDQPVINLHGGDGAAPTALSWYYPISPRLGLLLPEIGEQPIVASASLTSAQVRDLNARIVAASHRQVFGHSRSSLEPYV